jgi:glycerol uptake facilitator-like aquaporin
MRQLFDERFVSMLVGLIVLALSAYFPALAEQFEFIAPAVVAIILWFVGSATAERINHARTTAQLKIVEIESAALVERAKFQAAA